MNPETVKKLLSKSVYNRLTKTLLSIDTAKTVSEHTHAYDKLRDQLATLFTLRRIGQYPNQVMVDFAETLQGLYAEQDDIANYLFHIKKYLNNQIQKYEETLAQHSRRVQMTRKMQGVDPITSLDNEYQAWIYTHGYYKQQNEMYQYLLYVTDEVIRYDRARVKR